MVRAVGRALHRLPEADGAGARLLHLHLVAERTLRVTRINGEPGFIVYVSGQPLAAMILHVRDGRIQTIYAVANPDKLQAVPDHQE